MKRKLSFAFGICLMLIACSKSSTPDNTGGNNNNNNTGGNNTTSSNVSINYSAFSPGSLTIKTGTTVTWKNDDNMTHTATANGGSFDTGDIAPGASKSYTFTTAGSFPYHCTYHSGMTGTIVVNN